MSKKVLVLYVPVLHQGYIAFFRRWCGEIGTICIFGCELTAEFAHVEKEIRAMEPHIVAGLISALGFFEYVVILDRCENTLTWLRNREIITADESISRQLVAKYLPGSNVVYDSVFLRWDESYVASEKPPESFAVSASEFDRAMMQRAREEGLKSSDWWRRVGAILVKDDQPVLTVHNSHQPTEHSQYILGDIRDFVKPGEKSDIQSAIHAEKLLIATAAKQGIATAGADLYVSVFPCSDCAKVVAASGIKKCFFGGGHASFHGEDVLRFCGVELVFVE